MHCHPLSDFDDFLLFAQTKCLLSSGKRFLPFSFKTQFSLLKTLHMKKSVTYRVAKKMKNMLLLNHFSLGKVFMN